jgi:hypothetical protein
MVTKPVVASLFVLMLAILASGCNSIAPAVPQKQVALNFVSHVAAGLPEQDVFIEVAPGADVVKRLTAKNIETYMDAPVYASQDLVPRDPFQVGPDPLGPYSKGAELGFTMAEWLAGTGNGAYTVIGHQAYIDAYFDKLVPNNVYTVWCSHISVPPDFKIVDEPCGQPDGSQNTLITDAYGRAEFHVVTESLPDTTEKTMQVIAVAYHSHSQTYGGNPGDFGLNSHVQVLAFLPAPGDDTWQVFIDDNDSIAQR